MSTSLDDRGRRADTPKVTEELDFPEGPLAEHGVVEGCDPLDGDFRSRRDVHRGAARDERSVQEHIADYSGRQGAERK